MNEAPSTKTGTKDRILDASERLFAEKGIAATSLRSIIAAANVNLAAVHYHFGSKEELVKAVALRVTGPMNEKRLGLLDHLEREYGETPVPLESLVDAFVAPIVHLADDPIHGETFMRLMGRVMAEPDYFFGKIAAENFRDVRRRFVAAFRRTLPALPEEELFWRTDVRRRDGGPHASYCTLHAGAQRRRLRGTQGQSHRQAPDSIPDRGTRGAGQQGGRELRRSARFGSFWLGSFLLLSLALMAQAQPLPLSMSQAVELALEPDGAVRVELAREAIEQARAAKGQARAALLPNVDGYLQYDDRVVNLQAFGVHFDIPGLAIATPSKVGPFNVLDMRARANQTVFSLSAIRRFQAAGAGVRVANDMNDSTRERVAAEVSKTYLAALRSQARLEAAQANVALAKDLLQLAENQKAAGTGTGLDITRARVQLANENQQLLVAENDIRRARLDLLRAMDLRLDTEISLTDRLEFHPVEITDPESALATALDNRPDWQAQQRRERQAGLMLSAAKWDRLPSVAAFGDYGTMGNDFGNSFATRTYGVRVNIPIFDGGRVDARRAESASQAREAKIRTADLRSSIELDIRLSLDALRSAEAQVRVAADGVDLAGDELEQARRRFSAGVTNSIEVTDAQNRLARARDNRIAALFQYEAARLDLGAALGKVEEFIQ